MPSISKQQTDGLIGHYGLSDWWRSVFNPVERKRIADVYHPVGHNENILVEGTMFSPNRSPVGLLSGLVGWFKSERDRMIAYRILNKAESLASESPVLDRHFLYQAKAEVYYRFRNVDDCALANAIEGCRQQIALSKEARKAFRKWNSDATLPGHVGYHQLAIIYEKQGRIDEAIALCEEAMEQEWSGDWERRIRRYSKKQVSLFTPTKFAKPHTQQ